MRPFCIEGENMNNFTAEAAAASFGAARAKFPGNARPGPYGPCCSGSAAAALALIVNIKYIN